MMRKTLASLAAAAMASFGLTVIAPPSASADTLNCVTRKEYRRIENGMRVNRVEIIFDQRGELSHREGRRVTMGYDMCNRWHRNGEVYVVYKRSNGNLRAVQKLSFFPR